MLVSYQVVVYCFLYELVKSTRVIDTLVYHFFDFFFGWRALLDLFNIAESCTHYHLNLLICVLAPNRFILEENGRLFDKCKEVPYDFTVHQYVGQRLLVADAPFVCVLILPLDVHPFEGVSSLFLVQLLHQCLLRNECLDLELDFLGRHEMVLVLDPLTDHPALTLDELLQTRVQLL